MAAHGSGSTQSSKTAPAGTAHAGAGRAMSIAAAIMMSSVFLSRILGVVRERVLAEVVGAGASMDAYVTAFLIPDWVNHLLAGGFMSITFIPIFQKHLAVDQEDKAWRSFSNILATGSIVLFVLISLSITYAEEILGLLGDRISDPAQLPATARMTRIILPAQFCVYWGSLLMAVQMAKRRFLMPALAPLCYNVGIIVGGLVLGPHIGVEGFAWGVLGGAVVGFLLLQVVGALRVGMDLRPIVDLRDPDLRTYVLLTLPLMVGAGMQFSNETLFRVFGSFLAVGSIACLNYATKALWAINGLFGQAVAMASYPFMSKLVADGKVEEMNRVAHGVMGRIATMLLPSVAVMAVVSLEVVGVLYQGGRFTAEDSARTSVLLALYLIGAYGFAAGAIVSRCFYAMQNTLLPMILSSITVAVSLPLYWLLSRLYGAYGVALAGALSMNLIFVVLFTAWTRRHYDRNELVKLGVTVAKSLGGAAVGAGVAYGMRYALRLSEGLVSMHVLPRSLLIGGLSGAVGLAAGYLLLDFMGVLPFRAMVRDRLARFRAKS